ncbi:MAG: hypothetical protein ACOCWC_00410 [Bacteroidota bacterium]
MQEKSTSNSKNKSNKSSLSEVLNIFSHIDLKIMELHKYSSKDFLSLNNALKDNYKKAKFITAKTTETFEKLGQKGNLNTLQEVKQDFAGLKKQISRIEQKIDKSLVCVENIQTYINTMPVPINSFIQNICVLKLLFSNLKLSSTFSSFPVTQFTKEDNNIIEKELTAIKEKNQPILKKITGLQSEIKSLYEKLNEVKKQELGHLNKIIEKAQRDLNLIERHNKNALKHREALDIMSKQCSKNVESIITNLQYHDIIRQKMEHIQQTHLLVTNELNEIDKTNEEKEDAAKLFSCIVQIPQISEIQTAQLLHANKEFQQAIDQITKKMNEIGQNMSQTARTYNSLAIFNYQGEEINLEKTDFTFNSILVKCKDSLTEFENIVKNSSKLSKSIVSLRKEFQEIDMMDNSIEQMVVKKFGSGVLLKNPNKEVSNQAEQILKIYADNHYIKINMKRLFIDAIEQINKSAKINTSLKSKKHGVSNLEKIAMLAKEKIIKIKESFIYLNENKEQIQLYSEDIILQNKNAVKESQYYAYFEKTIDNIINDFNNISEIVKKNNLADIESLNNDESFKQIEDYYTMKSERIIHNQTVSEKLSAISESNNSSEDEGNDVEFF